MNTPTGFPTSFMYSTLRDILRTIDNLDLTHTHVTTVLVNKKLKRNYNSTFRFSNFTTYNKFNNMTKTLTETNVDGLKTKTKSM